MEDIAGIAGDGEIERTGTTVLVVDDSPEDVLMLRTVLESRGYRVRSAENGSDALELLRSEVPDLIVSDILMPAMDGFQLCRAVRREPRLHSIPFIFHTATYTDPQDERLAFDTGCDAFVTKAAAPEELLATVEAVLLRAERGPHSPPRGRAAEVESLKLYSERLVNKLEQKTQDLQAREVERREAEREFRRSERRFRAISESSADAILIAPVGGRISYANPSARALFGLGEDILQAPQLTGLVPERLREDFADAIASAATDGSDRREVVGLRGDGTEFALEISLSSWSEGSERMIGAVARDVSEAQTAMQELRLHAAALRAAANGVFITDRDGRIGWVNPAFERLSGYAAAELLGQNPRVVNAGAQSAELYEGLWRTILGGEPWVGQLINRRRDGELWTSQLSVTPVRDDSGEITHFVAIHQDVSERVKNLEALRRSEERLRGVVERAPYGIFRCSMDGRIVAANPAMAKMLGCEDEAELLAVDTAQDVFLDGDERLALVDRLLEAGDIGNVEVVGKRRDGSPVHVRLHGSAERNEAGEAAAIDVFAEDLTLNYELENQLRQSQKLEAIGSLTGGIAHDLNNLLTVIGGNAELARSSGTISGDMAACLAAIEGAARRGGTTMKRLLGFSRKADIELVPLDLSARIEGLAPMLRGVVPESIELVFDTRPVKPVMADGGAVEQIVINLVNNARDAMQDGGRLNLSVCDRTVGEGESELRPWMRAGEFVCVSVADTGTGMDEETRLRIFEPFFTTKEEGAGTGLGLAMVYGLMKQHGGFAHASEAKGGGTVMSLLFPAVEGVAPADSRSTEVLEGVLGGTETVLLVEDQGDVRRLCARALRKAGYTVIPASDGLEGLNVFREESGDIDLVVSDLVMPKMGGQALYEALLVEFGRVPFVLSSGYRERDMAEGLDSLEVPFLPKPWEISDLLRTVRRVLDAHREEPIRV